MHSLIFSQIMFPYDKRLLRCHPYWGQLRSPITDGDLQVNNKRMLNWVCCECEAIFTMATNKVTRGSCRCADHSKKLMSCKRPRYTGCIPLQITNIIRTSLLQTGDHDTLASFVTSMVTDIGCDGDPMMLANEYINEVSNYSITYLLDGGFWWEDSNQRKDGHRYKPPHRKRQKVTTNAANDSVDKADIFDEPSSTNNHETRGTHPVATDIEEMTRATEQPDADAHYWDDILPILRNDPRALWGEWEHVIAPKLDPGLPRTYPETRNWTADNVDVDCLIKRLHLLERQLDVAQLDTNDTVKEAFEVIFSSLSSADGHDDDCKTSSMRLVEFVLCVVGYGTVHSSDLTYARIVD